MDAVTYPDPRVIAFFQKEMIPLLVNHKTQPLAGRFNITWTPTLVTLDKWGDEHHRTVGFLPPEELIPSLVLGQAKIHFESDRFQEALADLERLLTDYPKSKAAPEAIYLRGVCTYKKTGKTGPLKEAYEKLQAEYPSSEWTTRASPYRLL